MELISSADEIALLRQARILARKKKSFACADSIAVLLKNHYGVDVREEERLKALEDPRLAGWRKLKQGDFSGE